MIITISLFLVITGAVCYRLGRTSKQVKQSIVVPRETRIAAQHAADMSMRQQVVTFVNGTFEISQSDKQHRALGEVVFVAAPDYSVSEVIGNYRTI